MRRQHNGRMRPLYSAFTFTQSRTRYDLKYDVQSLIASNMRLQQEVQNLEKGHADVRYLMTQEQWTLQARNERLQRIVADTKAQLGQMEQQVQVSPAHV
ncbi:hypothetical protein NM688_g5902 [Phlebia brevispora]|uniref:Uncharacterized protein n=1 Tax=Phlebia brevispora TaxID=194682 RepID=A0ACC1SMW0_9APHY|nr:hypothetical protein NM688_g5902 [Phlebia brevispora]